MGRCKTNQEGLRFILKKTGNLDEEEITQQPSHTGDHLVVGRFHPARFAMKSEGFANEESQWMVGCIDVTVDVLMGVHINLRHWGLCHLL